MGKDKKAKKKIAKLSDAKLFSLAKEREDEAAKEKIAKGKKAKIDAQILGEMERRGSKGLTQQTTGLSITYVQTTRVIYDDEGIRKDKRIKKSVLKRIFRRRYDFSLLPKERQEELHRAMVDLLTPAELKVVSYYVLDEDAMSLEVQNENIDAAVIADHSEIKKNAPYLNITPGKASS